ncbi:MAG: SulP family inorganic anion transporter, partial [Myxococcota bacterium]
MARIASLPFPTVPCACHPGVLRRPIALPTQGAIPAAGAAESDGRFKVSSRRVRLPPRASRPKRRHTRPLGCTLNQSIIVLGAREFLASIVVFLVALPLCMAIAIASGVPPAMGLVSGIIGGIVVGCIAGSPLQVSGPAAGLVVLVVEIVQAHGIGTLAVLIIIAGVLQIAAGVFRIGQWFRAIAPAVIYAMLAGIGVLIFASQFHVMVDHEPVSSGIINLITIPASIYKGIMPVDGSAHHLAAAIGMLTLVVLVGWNFLRTRLPLVLAVLPAPLLAVIAGSLAAFLFDLKIIYVKVPSSITELVRFPALDDFSALLDPALLGSAIALACVASAESLLSAAAVDKLHDGPRTNYDKELIAQGVGNMILGAIGGLPLTGVIVRS